MAKSVVNWDREKLVSHYSKFLKPGVKPGDLSDPGKSTKIISKVFLDFFPDNKWSNLGFYESFWSESRDRYSLLLDSGWVDREPREFVEIPVNLAMEIKKDISELMGHLDPKFVKGVPPEIFYLPIFNFDRSAPDGPETSGISNFDREKFNIYVNCLETILPKIETQEKQKHFFEYLIDHGHIIFNDYSFGRRSPNEAAAVIETIYYIVENYPTSIMQTLEGCLSRLDISEEDFYWIDFEPEPWEKNLDREKIFHRQSIWRRYDKASFSEREELFHPLIEIGLHLWAKRDGLSEFQTSTLAPIYGLEI